MNAYLLRGACQPGVFCAHECPACMHAALLPWPFSRDLVPAEGRPPAPPKPHPPGPSHPPTSYGLRRVELAEARCTWALAEALRQRWALGPWAALRPCRGAEVDWGIVAEVLEVGSAGYAKG